MAITQYDLEQLVQTQDGKELTEYDWNRDEVKRGIISFLTEMGNEYYMMLNKELSYYTLFRFEGQSKDCAVADKFLTELRLCAAALGKATGLYVNKEMQTIGLWIKTDADDAAHLFFIFPYDVGVVEIK